MRARYRDRMMTLSNASGGTSTSYRTSVSSSEGN
jgi:hypothetical protein